MSHTDEQLLCCSFCGKREDQARLIAGPGVYICSDCVQTCCDLLKDDAYNAEAPDHLPTPVEIKSYLDGYIIGQEDAKIALSVAVYNHYCIMNIVWLFVRFRHKSVTAEWSLVPSNSGRQ